MMVGSYSLVSFAGSTGLPIVNNGASSSANTTYQPSSGITGSKLITQSPIAMNNKFNQIVENLPQNIDGTSINNIINPNTPTVFGVYNDNLDLGVILIDQETGSNENKTISVIQKIMTPYSGTIFAQDFEGHNPFDAFENPNYSDLFMDISYQNFVAALGMAMQHEKAANGWLAVANTTTHTYTTTSTSWGIIGITTYYDVATTTPTWSELLPEYASGSDQESVAFFPIKNSTPSSLKAALANYPHTIAPIYNGEITSLLGTTSGFAVPSGVITVPVGSMQAGSTMPNNSYTSSDLSYSVRGLNLLGSILVGLLLGGIAGYIFSVVFAAPTPAINLGVNGNSSPQAGAPAQPASSGIEGISQPQLVQKDYATAPTTNISTVSTAGNFGASYQALGNSLNNGGSGSNLAPNPILSGPAFNQAMNPFSPDLGSSHAARAIDPWPNVDNELFGNAVGSLNPEANNHGFYGGTTSIEQGFQDVTPTVQPGVTNQPFIEAPDTTCLNPDGSSCQ